MTSQAENDDLLSQHGEATSAFKLSKDYVSSKSARTISEPDPPEKKGFMSSRSTLLHCSAPTGGSANLGFGIESVERRWYAVFTLPQNEKSALKHLSMRQIESFLPTYETIRVWKNRQRVKVVLPLFPTYLFVRIDSHGRSKVLQAPGVLQIVNNGREPLPLPDTEIEFLRSDFCRQKAEPFRELVVGQKVRVRDGVMQGIEGVLVRKGNGLRFVMTLGLINQHAAVEVRAEDLDPVCA